MSDNEELLSQSEIDTLLSALSSQGAVKTDAVAAPVQVGTMRRYDFQRPERFSREQMRALRIIHEAWARRASISLSAHLRTSVEIGLADIDQDTYTSLPNRVPEQGVYTIVSPSPLPGHLMLHMSLELAMIIVDRMMGGPGLVFKAQRSLTELEIELLRSISERMLSDLAEAWASTIPIRPRIDDISLNLLLVPIALPADPIVWVNLEVHLRGTTNSLVLGLPYSVLKPIAVRLTPYTWLASAEPDLGKEGQQGRQNLAALLNRVNVGVTVLLGTTQLSVEELASLQPGDVLPLSTPMDALCPVLVNGRLKYHAQPGLHQRRLAVQVARVIESPATTDLDSKLAEKA